jgi:hypothetical protein
VADQQQTNNDPEPQNQNSGGGDDSSTEDGFWKKLADTIDERIDAGIERGLKKHRPTGAQRTEGRTTIPGIFADIVFGKQKQS